MATKPIKPTKAQLAEAKIRAAASGIAMNQSAKGLRNASKAIIAAASMLPAGRAVKTAATAAKVAGAAKRVGAEKLLTAPKSNVKIKPAAKNKPNPPSAAKLMWKEMKSEKGESRKASIQTKKLPKPSNAATKPSNWGTGANRIMINSAKPTRVVKVNPKKK